MPPKLSLPSTGIIAPGREIVAQILRSKNLTTKFQILLEIAESQPNVQQKDIAKRLGITSQAVSEYVKELMKDGWLSSQGRSRYRVTREGVDWILKMSRQLQSYSAFVSKVISDISISAAIADNNLSPGQKVSLYMKDGLLVASSIVSNEGAWGIATSAAKQGEDVSISNIEGVMRLKTGKITIGKVPGVQQGGSRNTDIARLKEEVKQGGLIGMIGIEALVAMRRAGREPDYLYGVKEATIEAAYCGLPFLVVCTEDSIAPLVQRLVEENLEYRIVDFSKSVS